MKSARFFQLSLTCCVLINNAVYAQVQITSARIGCLDLQTQPNLTSVVGNVCNGKFSCSYKAPSEQEYRQAGVHARTRAFCTQAMEIVYRCGNAAPQTVVVPGDAWTHPPADLECTASPSSSSGAEPARRLPNPFPITVSRLDPINGVGYMQTAVTIASSGHLNATTHTWSAKDLEGFHGAVAAVVLDENRRLLWVSNTQNYGVEGKHVPLGRGPSDRTDNWNDTIPAQLLSHIHYIAIKQRWNPKPVGPDNIAAWLQSVGQDVAHELQDILQMVAAVNQTSANNLFPPEPLCPVGPNYAYVVTLGDSVMWGQGLPHDNKFRAQVTAEIQRELGSSRLLCEIPTEAHSGAQIVVSPDRETGLPGEIPSGWPSVTSQIDLTKRDMEKGGLDLNRVKLVLVDGGINDVGVEQILLPTNSSGRIEQMTRKAMAPLGTLLKHAGDTFPNAAIVVTGYFPIASSDSDVGALLAFGGAALGSAGAAEVLVGAGAGEILGGVGGAVFGADSKGQMVKNSMAFLETAHQQIADIIAALPVSYRARVTMAIPRFESINAYGARDTYLWRIDDFVVPEKNGLADRDPLPLDSPNGVAWTRAHACRYANRASPKCVDASMGHPNLKGAEAYTMAIAEAIRQPRLWALIASR